MNFVSYTVCLARRFSNVGTNCWRSVIFHRARPYLGETRAALQQTIGHNQFCCYKVIVEFWTFCHWDNVRRFFLWNLAKWSSDVLAVVAISLSEFTETARRRQLRCFFSSLFVFSAFRRVDSWKNIDIDSVTETHIIFLLVYFIFTSQDIQCN